MRFCLLAFVAILLAFTSVVYATGGWSSIIGRIEPERVALDVRSAVISVDFSFDARAMGNVDSAASPPRALPLARGTTMAQGDYRALAREFAADSGIDADIFERQIQQESRFDPKARSSAGAVGIAQIVPQWHPTVEPTDPIASLRYAASLMALYLDRYHGDYATALAAYNAGPGAVARYGGIPPYWETQNYVWTILGSP